MAVEYIHNTIKATAGQDITVAAKITDANGELLTDSCGFMLHDDEKMITRVDGYFDGEVWEFTLPAKVTENLCGRFWYCIYYGDQNLCFQQPIYLI